ncbi:MULTISPECIES: serine O-acetyltransferase EpsC [unclassified Saccharicrinis]|uniref:serine O-acetyltransferase EpsC n=1 Tax=unclassified Saccharicrinis TaxID=2646859 RepID=UPI003D344EFC
MTTFKYPGVLQETIKKLANEESYKAVCHTHFFEYPMPSSETLAEIVNLAREIIFPGYFGDSPVRSESIYYYLGVNTERLFELLNKQILAGLCFQCEDSNSDKLRLHKERAFELTKKFVALLPELRRALTTDVDAAFVGDPAAKSKGEVIFCYPAIRAISSYRIAHALVNLEVPIIPRMISEMAHSETGIDIHPKAKIDKSFTIDHGTGVVIGATSIIGKNVKLFQGVTLGAKSFPLDENGNPIKGIPRHPIVEDDVVIYSQATILGRITVGKGSVIGGNVWVTNDVPPGSKIVQFKPRDILFAEGGGI